MRYTDRHGKRHLARETVCAECGKPGIADAATSGPTICSPCRLFGKAFLAAVGVEIDRRNHVTQNEGLYRSKVSRTPMCAYDHDDGPTLDIDEITYCVCEACIVYRSEWSQNQESLVPEVPEDCLC